MAKNELWLTIKTEYITTNTTQRELANKYAVDYSVLARRCSKEKWVQERKKYVSKSLAKTLDKTANKEANKLAKLIDATSRAVDISLMALQEEKQFNKYIVTEGIGGGATETVEKEFSKIDTKALKELTGALKDLTALMRDFYNIPTPAQAEAQRIAAERLNLEQKKASADGTDNTIKVVLSPELEDLAR